MSRPTIDPLAGAMLVTGNRNKLGEARRVCGSDLRSHDLDLPEIQSLDLLEVLRAKGKEAWRQLGDGRAVIVEETGLSLDGLNGFPGPLVKWMLEAIGAEGIARVGIDSGDPGVTARCALLYRDGERTVVAEGTTRGALVLPGRGGGGFGWDPVFQPSGSDRTYGEMSPDEKIELGHRGSAWRELTARLIPTRRSG